MKNPIPSGNELAALRLATLCLKQLCYGVFHNFKFGHKFIKLTYLLACLLAYLFTYLLTCLLTYLLACLLTYLLTYLLACLLAYLLTYLVTHSTVQSPS